MPVETSLSIYVHTPYCLQRCRYCDFTTFEYQEIYSPKSYFADLIQEIRNRHHLWPTRSLRSIYFGGGTPSLVDPEFIISVLEEFANLGFAFLDDRIHPSIHPPEVTIEINPATVSEKNLDLYLKAGINRFSVGAQTFSDRLLKMAGRKHSAEETRDTLRLLKSRNLNYSFDLLFALPQQSLEDLERDLAEISEWNPPHLSTYCLTVPEGHPMSYNRPHEEVQIQMFDRIEAELDVLGLQKYEISNFAKPGFESSHNLAYWHDHPFWGVGLSSHSYDPALGPYGSRFWNSKSIKAYTQAVHKTGANWNEVLENDQIEMLLKNEAMTDLCHMFLRTRKGLPAAALQKFQPNEAQSILRKRLNALVEDKLLMFKNGHWSLTRESEIRSNLVFEKLTFLKNDAN